MTDDLTVAEAAADGADKPKPVSDDTDKVIEGGNADLSRLLDAKLSEALKPVLSEVRGLQSRQDKSDKVNREFMDEYRKNLKSGMSESAAEIAAQETLDVRSAEKRRNEWIDRQIAASSSAGNGTIDMAKAIAKYELSESDPEVIEASRGKSGDALDAALANIALKKARSNPPSAAAASAARGGATPPDRSPEALLRDYLKELSEAAGKGNQFGNAIKEKYRALGLDVDLVHIRV